MSASRRSRGRRLVAGAVLAVASVSGGASASPSGSLLAFVAAEGDGVLVAVDVERGKVVRRIRVPAGPHNVAATRDGRFVLVTSPPADRVTAVSSASLRVVRRFTGLPGAHDVKALDRYAFVADARAGRIAVLDLERARVVARLALGAPPHDLALSPDGRSLWVTLDPPRPGIAVVDVTRPARPRLTGRVTTVQSPHDVAFAPRGSTVWVTRWGATGVAAVNARSGRPVRSTEIGGEPHHFAFATDGSTLWVTDNAGGRVALVDTRAGKVLRSLRAGPSPHHPAVLGGRAAVALNGAGALAVFDLAGRRIATVAVGTGPHGVALVRRP